MVVGDRDVAQHRALLGARRSSLQRLGSWVVRRASGTDVPDTTSGFRAYNREAAIQLQVVSSFTYTLESLIQAGKMLVAVDHVPIGTNPKTARVAAVPLDLAPTCAATRCAIFRAYAMYEPLRVFTIAAVVLAVAALAAWTPFLVDWILNGDSSGHIQSLILGAVLAIAAVQLFALGVIGDALAGQRVMTQRVFERVRRVELTLGIEPSHYERRRAEPRAARARVRALDPAPADGSDQGPPRAPAPRRRYGKTAGLLSLGVGATGLITYLYFALASHNLGKDDYGELVVLWSAVFITVSTLYRPVEQLLSRTIAEREARGQPTAQPMRVAAMIQVGAGAGFAAVALALARTAPGRPPLRQRDPLLGPGRDGRSPTRRATSPAGSSPAAAASPSTRR